MVSDVQIVGLNNNPPYQDVVPVSVVQDNNNITRLCTSAGIPLLGNVTNYKSVTFVNNSTVGPQTIYTAPAGKTFYILDIIISNATANSDATYDFNVGNTRFYGGQASGNTNISNGFVLAIVTEGQTIVDNIGYGGQAYSYIFLGYEIFGSTN